MADVVLPLVGPSARSEEWFALRRFDADRDRKVVFGATQAAPICGLSPYKTPFEVFVECQIGVDREPTEAMLNGLDFEDAVLNIYERKRKVGLRRNLPMFFHGKYKWMGATPDAIGNPNAVISPPPSPDPTCFLADDYGVDAKTSTFRRLDKDGDDPLKFGRENTDELPCDYILQGVQQCEVLSLPYVDFPVLFDSRTMRIYRVERNADLSAAIIKAEQEMYERLCNNDPPEPNWEHENTRELIGILFGHKEEIVRELDEEDACRWQQIQQYKDEIKTREEVVTIELNRLMFKLEGASRGVFPSGTQQLKRIVVKESLVTEKDVLDLKERVGQTKRKGYEFLKQTKVDS